MLSAVVSLLYLLAEFDEGFIPQSHVRGDVYTGQVLLSEIVYRGQVLLSELV